MSRLPSLDHDAVWPRVPEYRYRVYGRRGDALHVLAAAPTAGGLGEAIVTLDDDCRRADLAGSLGDYGSIGVLDVLPEDGHPRGRWILNPWHRPEGR